MASDSELVIEALGRIAADPASWDALLDLLPDEDAGTTTSGGGEAAIAWAHSAALAQHRRGEGDPQAAPPEAGWIVLSDRDRVVSFNSQAAVAFETLGDLELDRPLAWTREANAVIVSAALRRVRAGERQLIVRLETGGGPRFAFAGAVGSFPLASDAEAAGALAGLVFPAVDENSRLWGVVRDSFGLTEAEVRVARLLRDGLSMQQIAERLDVSARTVRNQLQSVFAKLGVQRQSDLVRALTELAGVNRAMDSPGLGAATAGAFADAPPVLSVTLADGRTLAYREYGASAGRPVLILHGTPGSSLLPSGADARARALGLRLIAPDRPGFGLSSPAPGYSFPGVAADMVALADELGLERLAVGGAHSGAAFALHVAARLGARATLVMASSGRAPGSPPRDRNPLARMRRRMEAQPWIAEALFGIVRLRHTPQLTRRLLGKAAAHSAGDAAFLAASPWVVDYVHAYAAEALAQGSRGAAAEMQAFRTAPADAPAFACPLILWSGAEDAIIPARSFGDYVGARPAEVRVIEDIGHFMPMKHWFEILQRLAAPPPPP
ncbi:MAG: alpha/beta fold hydrolase [Phenylobacterium sp.]|uniref:alpha/beta fold hydrolase n=1 Tax=Phenylobacterium sp. TaxID=1871053 RepID=UPI001A4EA7C4|nr:alpha/beta fold hydrolase [Phenylobacterium sp.]MBL8555312.1 alpha/beta fold hydrolase [Phenylobacterium sp.]